MGVLLLFLCGEGSSGWVFAEDVYVIGVRSVELSRLWRYGGFRVRKKSGGGCVVGGKYIFFDFQ